MIPEFLDENSLRAYPLKSNISYAADSGYTLQYNIVCDALLHTNGSKLSKIISTDTTVSFYINNELTPSFTVLKSSSLPSYIKNQNTGLLVVNSLDIPQGIHIFTNLYFEESVCVPTTGWQGVSSIAFGSYLFNTGNVVIDNGYQFDITVSASTLGLWAGSFYGTPLGCNTVLGITNDCSSVVSYINGAQPNTGNIDLLAGNNINIIPDPTNHRVFIGLNYDVSNLCPPM